MPRGPECPEGMSAHSLAVGLISLTVHGPECPFIIVLYSDLGPVSPTYNCQLAQINLVSGK